jgi:hypothetical protein
MSPPKTVWCSSVQALRHQLKQGLGQMKDQLAPEREMCGVDSDRSDHSISTISDDLDTTLVVLQDELMQKLYRSRRLSSISSATKQSKDRTS